MRTIARLLSTGARILGSVLLICIAANGTIAAAQPYSSGQEAYANRDWGAARAIWTAEAASGSAEGLLGLGNLLDFGLTGPPDREAAFEMYRKAALLGHPEAAFNMAVMLDSGIGTPVDKRAAAGWYSMAALDGFARAEYNLGLIFQSGDGVPANARVASAWLQRASNAIPSSADALAASPPASATELAAPTILQVLLLGEGAAPSARVAWASGPGPEGSRYRVEVVNTATGHLIASAEAETTAIAMPLQRRPQSAWVRVLQLTARDYASSDWVDLEGQPVVKGPGRRVRFQVGSADRRAAGYVQRMGSSLERSGIVVSYDDRDPDQDASAIVYGFDSDMTFATDIAGFLPGLSGGNAMQQSDAGISPGEVVVRMILDSSDEAEPIALDQSAGSDR
ncbi:tetratricopeptide repeat protein [Paracoccus sp. 1_MG-2023]|uniref:tetratricopeptide repeat protein n=1 Tax=unclassified Paracoccus (in: a-proteobacteria) TaxID=2688777 RepID=UPI001C07F7AC|nr:MULTISPECIES: tetratricopeptide repeat protein [unclassified Paracoccus (in: a-proteobacteria)]MBU2957911.1 sel1 repeat family protein [Paracoccus sp. C2R09]MDO6668896.1 tetratricopeptide repeat protein [Paracoccus sp. 1_MG-2023]